jgi:hypothetical protein
VNGFKDWLGWSDLAVDWGVLVNEFACTVQHLKGMSSFLYIDGRTDTDGD